MKRKRQAPTSEPPARDGVLDATLDGELLQDIDGNAALLAFAVAGIGGNDPVAIEPIAAFAKQLHSDILSLMKIANVEV
jgi:hypothetical protein